MLANAGSLVSTTVITSGLGFVYWWLAARQFSPEAVGLGSAAISAMLFLGNLSIMGFGTLLIGELPRQPGKEASLIGTALIVVGFFGGVFGLLFVFLAPWASEELHVLSANVINILLFALGVSFTSITFVLDQSVVGLLRSDLQLVRNTIFAVVKLLALAVAGFWMYDRLGLTIYSTWLMGNLVSVGVLAGYALRKNRGKMSLLPQWILLRRLGSAALAHHLFNLTLQASGLIMPIVVTVVLSARMNAYFYTAWMVASFAAVVPVALTTVLYAVGASDPAALASKIRLTLKLSVFTGVAVNIVFLLGADLFMGLFRDDYAEYASLSLQILGLAVFPQIIKNHFVVIQRIRGRVLGPAFWMMLGGLLELVLAALGASVGGLAGLCLGWVIAMTVQAGFMVRTVFETAMPESPPSAALPASP